jgi:phage shock protein A
MAITDKDVTKLKEVFYTKEDGKKLEGHISQIEGHVSQIGGHVSQIEGRVSQIEGQISQLKDIMLTRFDRIISEQDKAREDRVFAKAKDDEQDRRLDRLEAKVG